MRRFSFFLVSAATVAVLAAIGEPAISEAGPPLQRPGTHAAQVRAALRVTLPQEAGVYHVRVGPVDPEIAPHDTTAPEHLRLGDAYYTGSAWDLRDRLTGGHDAADYLFVRKNVHVMYWRLVVDPGGSWHDVCDCVRYWEQRVMDHLGNAPTNRNTRNRARAVNPAEMDAMSPRCEKMHLAPVALAYPPPPGGRLTRSEAEPLGAYQPSGAQQPPRTLQGDLPVPLRTALLQRLPDSPGVYRLIDSHLYPIYSYVGSARSVRDRLLYQHHPTAHLLLRRPCVGVAVAPIDMTRAVVPATRRSRVCSCLTYAEQWWMNQWDGPNAPLSPPGPPTLSGPARMLNEERPMTADRMTELQPICQPVIGTYQAVWPLASDPQAPNCGPGGGGPGVPAGPGPGGGPPDDHVTTCKQKGQPCEDDTQCCEDGATDKPFVGANSWKAVCVPDSAGAKVCVKPTCVPRDKPCNRGDEVNQLQYQGRSCCYDGATEMPVQGGQYAYTCHYISSDNLNGTCKQ